MRWLVLLATLAACGGDEASSDQDSPWKPKEAATVVAVADAHHGTVRDTMTTSAVVEAERAADIMAGATGTVVSIAKDVGDTVRRGDVLAVIDNATLDAGAERARAELRHLRAQYEEMKVLADRGAVSRRELADLEHQMRTARTSAREASASLDETRLTAPFDGVVAARDVRVGELANGTARAFHVVDLGTLRVVASLPERDVSRVELGQVATLTAAYDPTASASARVERISPIIDAESGTFQVRLGLDPTQRVLRPGQYVSVDLEIGRRDGVLVVPVEAIRHENGVSVVYRMVDAPEEEAPEGDAAGDVEQSAWFAGWFGDDNAPIASDSEENANAADDQGPGFVATRTLVETGWVDDASVEIRSGLDVGDQVITVGHANLRDGAKVEPAPDPSGTPTSGSTQPVGAAGDKG